jgi:hypothetical protein
MNIDVTGAEEVTSNETAAETSAKKNRASSIKAFTACGLIYVGCCAVLFGATKLIWR